MISYALTIFTGAFLLFQVQPLIGKYILPWFGGSPGVWTTCLLFFQLLLLGGYAYAHGLSSRATPKRQMQIHLVLLLLSLAFLPIIPPDRWKPEPGADPTWGILRLLAVCIGLPYFVLSATGPLLQHWFSRTYPGRSPYRLYSLSNVGSLLALLSYPFFFEPRFTRQTQAWLWSGGLVVYVGCCAYCAWRAGRLAPSVTSSPATLDLRPDADASPPPPRSQKWLWIAFPAIASILLMATTNKLCQDVAVIPFLWILPLALYLLSFILCFDHPRWYVRSVFGALFIVSTAVVVTLLFKGNGVQLYLQVAGYSFALFVACMVCHGELFQLRPPAAYLTKYYLFIATGGALGGLLVAVVAPLVFNRYVELQIGIWLLTYLLTIVCVTSRSLALAAGMALGALLSGVVGPVLSASKDAKIDGWSDTLKNEYTYLWHNYGLYAGVLVAIIFGALLTRPAFWKREWSLPFAAVPLTLTLGLGMVLIIELGHRTGATVEATRNFYGALAVTEQNSDSALMHYYMLVHGSITHGLQFTQSPQSKFHTSYYGETSGVGLAIEHVPAVGGRKIGVVGLGTGTLATYGKPGDRFRFYDINPAVERLARSRFSYLSQSPASIQVVLGDARLSMERELRDGDVQHFDVLALDAFSSDAIPVHLLTKEAIELYLQHLAFGGIIAVHTSNRYLSLDPVVLKIADELGLHSARIADDPPEKEWWVYRSTWILLSRSADVLEIPQIAEATSARPKAKPDLRLWTDDYASLFPVLR